MRDVSRDSPGGPGWVGGPSRGPRQVRGSHGGQGLVVGLFRMYGTGRGTFLKVRDKLGDSPKGLRRIGGTSRRSRTGRGTLSDVRVWLRDPFKGPGQVGRPPGGMGRVGGSSRRSRNGRGTIP